MPHKPLKPCKHLSCPKLTSKDYCDEHLPLHERATANERGYDSRWRSARKKFLQEHPFCTKCHENNKLIPSTVVDHIIPHRGNQLLFWDRKNWQPLCKQCHDKKTITEDRYQEYRYPK